MKYNAGGMLQEGKCFPTISNSTINASINHQVALCNKIVSIAETQKLVLLFFWCFYFYLGGGGGGGEWGYTSN